MEMGSRIVETTPTLMKPSLLSHFFSVRRSLVDLLTLESMFVLEKHSS